MVYKKSTMCIDQTKVNENYVECSYAASCLATLSLFLMGPIP